MILAYLNYLYLARLFPFSIFECYVSSDCMIYSFYGFGTSGDLDESLDA